MDKNTLRQLEYQKESLTIFELRFSPINDTDILAHLDTVDSKTGYIRLLLRNDLIQKGFITGSPEVPVYRKGKEKTTKSNPRTNIKFVTGGPDQPIIDYLQKCQSKIDYIRFLIRQDMDRGGTISNKITTDSALLTVDAVRSSAERTLKVITEFAAQYPAQKPQADPLITALEAWIATHK